MYIEYMISLSLSLFFLNRSVILYEGIFVYLFRHIVKFLQYCINVFQHVQMKFIQFISV